MSSEKSYLNDSYKSFFEDSLSVKDPELYKAIKDELIRQQQHIELIASENIVSQAVLEAQGSVLTQALERIDALQRARHRRRRRPPRALARRRGVVAR